jgi:hypothetical protein
MTTLERAVLFAWVFFFVFECVAQENPVYKNYQENVHRQKELTQAGIKVPEWWATLGYNVKTLRDLKLAGIDVSKALPDYWGWDERIKTVFSDCILIGTVQDIEYDSSSSSRFHTKVRVKVEEYLRNDFSVREKQLVIPLETGPLMGGMHTTVSYEPTFVQHEKVLLFLSATASLLSTRSELLSSVANTPSAKDSLLSGKYKEPEFLKVALANQPMQFSLTHQKAGKYTIRSGVGYSFARSKALKDIRSDVRATMRLLNRSMLKK